MYEKAQKQYTYTDNRYMKCQALTTVARCRQDFWASPAKNIWPLEKKLGHKQATPPNHLKKCIKNLCMQIIEPIFANYC
jgi:hypothetical protein